MQIVIEIDENMYQKIKGMENLILKNRTFKSLELAVLEGKVLPEKHGDLKDAGDILESIRANKFGDSDNIFENIYNKGMNEAMGWVRHSPTIIPSTVPPHWIERCLSMGVHDWICSVCRCNNKEPVKICPQCGSNTEGRYELKAGE